MSRKDYVKFAEMFSVAASDSRLDPDTVSVLALMSAVVFAGDNDAFDIDRYMQACEPSQM